MPARHCARSALLSARSALLSARSALEKPQKKKRPRARALFPGRGRGRRRRSAGAHTPARDRSEKKGGKRRRGGPRPRPRFEGGAAEPWQPIDFNDRRMSLEALDLSTEREGVRLAGRNGRAGGGKDDRKPCVQAFSPRKASSRTATRVA